jgi:2'-hydroxyisoflavone reductase
MTIGGWVKLLVIGGTRFVGRAFVELAVEHGHEVAVFHRSVSEPDDFPRVEHLHGDRDGQLDLVGGRSWDAVLDTCAYVPRVVREAAAVLRDAAGHYTLVSTLSVHPDDMPAGSTERAAVYAAPFPQTEVITAQTYGPLKVACEQAATAAFGDRCLIIRPGYIVGPHDPTDRFTFYLRRAAGGGEMAAPGPPDALMQVVDVRDLAAFMLGRIEAADSDVYGVVGPGEPIVMRDVLGTARDVAAASTTFTWLSEEFLKAAGDQAQEWFPSGTRSSLGCTAMTRPRRWRPDSDAGPLPRPSLTPWPGTSSAGSQNCAPASMQAGKASSSPPGTRGTDRPPRRSAPRPPRHTPRAARALAARAAARAGFSRGRRCWSAGSAGTVSRR